jgi:hypothetical protein
MHRIGNMFWIMFFTAALTVTVALLVTRRS